MQKVNNLTRFIGKVMASVVLLSFIIVSCNQEEKSLKSATASFNSTAQTVSESSGTSLVITISFDKSAPKDGTITILINEGSGVEYSSHYTTSPNGSSGSIEIPVTKGQTAAQFTVTPLNNGLLDGTKTLEFVIDDVTSGLSIGEKTALTLSITDDEGPTEANFATDSGSTTEDNGDGIEVVINLTSPAPGTGNVVVTFNSSDAAYTTNFTTTPAASGSTITIPVAQDATTASFTVFPVDDNDVNETRSIDFTISNADGVIEVGDLITGYTLSLTDNETPSTVTFEASSSSVSEGNSSGVLVSLALDPQTVGTGTVEITIDGSAEYGTDFTTDPAAVGGVITVSVGSGVTAVTFTVIPVDNSDEGSNPSVGLTITGSSGIVVKGSSNLTHSITIGDNDVATTIAAVRAMFSGSEITITDDIFIRGVVTSSNDNLTSRNAFIQDATGAIQMRFASANTLTRGDQVKVTLKDVLLGQNSGLLQIGGSSGMPNANAVKETDGVLPDYAVITVAQLNSGSYESQLVKLQSVGFFDANGTNNLRYNGGSGVGNNLFGNAAGDKSIIRVESYAPFASDVIPYGTGDIQGIASVFNSVYQIIPQATSDIFTSSEVQVITIDQTSLDFGDVANGATADLTLQVSGTSLVGDVEVTAPNNYSVSLDAANFSKSVTITAATANAGATNVTVRFEPATGTDQTLAGNVTIKSLGASVKTTSVTGNETGNGGSSALLNETFDSYTVGSALTDNGWTISGATVTNLVSVVSGGLDYTGYPSAGGNGVGMVNTGQDVYKTFTAQSSGTVYLSFLGNLSAAQTGDYFIALSASTNQTNYYARLHAKSSGSGYVVGVKKNNETNASYGTTELSLNTTYLFVVKYNFNTGSTTDDDITVYLFTAPTIPASEPATGEVTAYTEATKTDASDIGIVSLRQGSSSAAPTLVIDGIRVALSWSDLLN